MITIAGPEGTKEYLAAEMLAHLLREWHPPLEKRHDQRATVIVKAKCPGSKPAEVDLLLILAAKDNAPLPMVQTPSGPQPMPFLFMAFEVKSHNASSIQFLGASLQVRYDGQWRDVSESVHNLPHAVKQYLATMAVEPVPYTAACCWLTNVASDALPRQTLTLGANSPFTDFLEKAILNGWSPVAHAPQRAGHKEDVAWWAGQVLHEHFCAPRIASATDRRKIELITRRALQDQQYAQSIGTQLLLIRGAPGTGKTTKLLQLAHDLIRDKGARVLLLTYNLALATDVRRLMAIAPARSDDIASGLLAVRTSDKFFRDMAVNAGVDLTNLGVDYDANYTRILSELALLTRDHECTPTLRQGDFRFDFVLVDEGQDWSPYERRILFDVYGFGCVVVAEGQSQHVKTFTGLDWRADLPTASYVVLTLRRMLRQVAGLCDFLHGFLSSVGLSADGGISNRDIPGGRVIICVGEYANAPQLHEELVAELRSGGNELIDMLFLVPPGTRTKSDGATQSSSVADSLRGWGYSVWDGVQRSVRQQVQKSVDDIRIVNYQSARGLEAWTAVATSLDVQFEFLLKEARAKAPLGSLLQSSEQAALDHAYRQLMIPLSRPAHTLVITLTTDKTPLLEPLKAAHRRAGDIVEWRYLSAGCCQ